MNEFEPPSLGRWNGSPRSNSPPESPTEGQREAASANSAARSSNLRLMTLESYAKFGVFVLNSPCCSRFVLDLAAIFLTSRIQNTFLHSRALLDRLVVDVLSEDSAVPLVRLSPNFLFLIKLQTADWAELMTGFATRKQGTVLW